MAAAKTKTKKATVAALSEFSETRFDSIEGKLDRLIAMVDKEISRSRDHRTENQAVIEEIKSRIAQTRNRGRA